ncbi:hypothetical protein TrST_g12844 [Triparma strigata]|uniref:CDP-diacylglycerol--glycerol-3-phosphate 3-phosphatidyltransferase n=1 Tax=Triparma strigata TaxID=1606541 RepID=A0A9W7BE23_9STRA|nr:hypothetical protein TrST_g12844 [Triparma strigata]
MLLAARTASGLTTGGVSNKLILPTFTLSAGDIAAPMRTPTEFHDYLTAGCARAQHRVQIGSLYIGAGSPAVGKPAPLEDRFLSALSSVKSDVKLQVLIDGHRGSREINGTSSAAAVSSAISDHPGGGVRLFSVPSPLPVELPSPLNEAAGVFHMKAYIFDDDLLLTGANLSEEYFSDRLDRYMLFKNGAGGLVDFYSELLDTLSDASSSHGDSNESPEVTLNRENLIPSLEKLYKKYNEELTPTAGSSRSDTIGHAVPTIQLPACMRKGRPELPFPSDSETTMNIIDAAASKFRHPWVGLSSAYLNPTDSLAQIFGEYVNKGGEATFLTAGGSSHGFAPKKKDTDDEGEGGGSSGSGRGWIPDAYLHLSRALKNSLKNSSVLHYERQGWTFHAKGMWLCDLAAPSNPPSSESLKAVVVGSGNYGSRSESLDVESNCVVIFEEGGEASSAGKVKQQCVDDWNLLCEHAEEISDGETGVMGRIFFNLVKTFL